MAIPKFNNYEEHDENGRAFHERMAHINITIYRDGAMAVHGTIEDKDYALKMLDAARQSVLNHHDRKQLQRKGGLILPS